MVSFCSPLVVQVRACFAFFSRGSTCLWKYKCVLKVTPRVLGYGFREMELPLNGMRGYRRLFRVTEANRVTVHFCVDT